MRRRRWMRGGGVCPRKASTSWPYAKKVVPTQARACFARGTSRASGIGWSKGFAAWAVTSARVVDAATPAGRTRFATLLGERLCDPTSCLGLFVECGHLDRIDRCRAFDTILAVAERSRRLVARSAPSDLDPELRALLEHLPPGEPLSTLKDWLDLGANEVLVVPRLGALARRAAFDDELKSLRVAAGLA